MKNKLMVFFIFVVFVVSIVFIYNKEARGDDIILADSSSGDVNGDGKINSADYVLIRKYLLNNGTLNADQKKRADANGDGKVNSSDYVVIRKTIISGGGAIPTPAPTASLAYSDLPVIDSKYNYEVADFNVVNYGADPTGVKDSTEAFKKALLDAANCSKSGSCGGTVYAPKGKYLLNDRIDVHTYTSLVGDLEEGTTNGTILMIKHHAGSTDYNHSAVIVQVLGSIRNIAFWYPDQKLDGANPVKYPPTVTFGGNGTDGVTLENLYFVNSYTAMDFASSRENESIQFIRRIYGTPLHIGLVNDTNYDTMKLENINFSPKYWLNSGLSNIPSSDSLNRALMNSSTMPTGILLKRLDWFFLANVNIEGYYMGVDLQKSAAGGAEGEIFDSNISGFYPVYMHYVKHMTISNSTLKATGSGTSRAIHITSLCDFDISIFGCNISSSGDYAIYHEGSRALSISSSKISGRIGKANSGAQISLVGNKMSNTGMDGCSFGDYSEFSINSNYKRRVSTKPKSKNLIKINASTGSDITNKIKDAINKLKSIGGIVYIPKGHYTVSSNITIPGGVEVRGAIAWAHHKGYEGSTVLDTTYKGDSIFTLESNAGLNGLAIRQVDNENTGSIKEYPYAIKGKGNNIYITNIVLATIFNGINLSGCDNHYLEHIWGEFYNMGINVDGGSKNGIIRDSHFTINTLASSDNTAISTVLNKQTVIRIGSSSNEVILNTFTFGPNIGYDFDGASDFFAAGIGVDFANIGIRLSGGAKGTIINPMLVTRTVTTWFNKEVGGNPLNNHYIVSTGNYSGMVKIINSINWGNDRAIAVDLSGIGDIHLSGGIIENAGAPAIRTSNSAQSIVGVILAQPKNGVRYQLDSGASGVTIIGNICVGEKSCYEKIRNNCGISVGYADPKTTCDTPTPTGAPAVNSPEWEQTVMFDTSVSATTGSTKLCGLSGSGTLEYSGNCTSTKTASISGGCAIITLNACPNDTLSYRVQGASEWKKANSIGKYLIFGQVYNKLLYPGTSASNNASNIGNWVSTCSKVSDCIKSIGATAANVRASESNEAFVQGIYQGVLGRSADGGGLSGWVGAINSGTTRAQVVSNIVDSQEAIAIYQAWGYN